MREVPKPKGCEDLLTAEDKVAFAQKTEILELKTATVFVVCFLKEVNARDDESKTDLKKAQETAVLSDSQQKALTENVSLLAEVIASTIIERAKLEAIFDETTALVHWMNNDVRQSLCNVSSKVWETFQDMVKVGYLKV